jgi:ceramide glucosyltransferase
MAAERSSRPVHANESLRASCFFAWTAGLFGNRGHRGKKAFSIKACRKLMAAEEEAAASPSRETTHASGATGEAQ